ncbi:MAG: hypothetical protein K6G23_02985 [Lachnospiraceae bacterium]|nr:hypothetical protein [Lachnospiraceae bacterium]
MNRNSGSDVSYRYSSAEQEELRSIEEKYVPKTKEEDDLEKLRKLDAAVDRKARIAAIMTGVTGTLILGIGMCCCLVWTRFFIAGIIIGLVGMAGIVSAMPVYNDVQRREKEKVTPQVLELINKLKQ